VDSKKVDDADLNDNEKKSDVKVDSTKVNYIDLNDDEKKLDPSTVATLPPMAQVYQADNSGILSASSASSVLSTDSNTCGDVIRVPLPPQVRPGQTMHVQVNQGTDSMVTVSVPMFSEWKMDDQGNRYFNYFVSNGNPMPLPIPPNEREEHRSFVNRHNRGKAQSVSSGTEGAPFMSWYDVKTSPYNSSNKAVTQVKVSEDTEPIIPSGRRKALLIGINYVGSPSRLNGCANDAMTLRHVLLQNNFKDDPEHMIIMIDEFDDDLNCSSPLPTKANIRKGMKWLVQGAAEGDVLFLHFSGHGGQTKDETGFESDGLNETIMPLDFSTKGQITDDEIWDTIVFPLPDGVKLIAVMDCCHSGTGLDLPYDLKNRSGLWKEDINPAHSKGDVIQFSGCRDSQYSADADDRRKQGGAMTTAFAYALKKNPFATYGEMMQLIYANLKERKFKQRPQLTASQRFDVNKKVFSFVDGIERNKNTVIGRRMRKPSRKKRFFGLSKSFFTSD